jgi:hypothetical protein
MGSLFTSNYRYDPTLRSGDIAAAQQQQRANMAGQQALAQQLQAQAMGVGPSVAQEALKQAMNRGTKQTTAAMASQKGINPALAQRMAADIGAQGMQETAAQGAQLRAQEQLGAQGALGGLYGQMGQQALTAQGQMLAAQQAQNQINAGIEAQNAANIAGLAGGFLNAAGSAATMGMMRQPVAKAHGGKIEGKAKVPGDHEANDTVPAMLSPGEIVIPRSKASDPAKAKEFVDNLLKSDKRGGDDDMSYGKVLEAHRKLQARVKELEEKLKSKK